MPRSRKQLAQPATVWSDAPWISRRPADEKRKDENSRSFRDVQGQGNAVPAEASAPGRSAADLDSVQHSLSMLTFTQCTTDGSEFNGPCALVCQEDGSIAGYFFDSASHSSWVVSGQVLLHPVDCQQDPDWRLLIVRLQRSKWNQNICTLVEKHGGDAFRLSAPEKSTLEILHLLTSNIVRAETLMQLSFETHTLKFGSHIRQDAVWARNLQILESSVVNLGTWKMIPPKPVG